MSKEFIVLGVEDGVKKSNGLYLFSSANELNGVSLSEWTSVVKGKVFKKSVRDLEQILISPEKETLETPRVIKSFGDTLYFLTRAHVVALSLNAPLGSLHKQEWSFSTLFSMQTSSHLSSTISRSSELDVKFIEDNPTLDGCIETRGLDVYFSLFVADKMKRDKSILCVGTDKIASFIYKYNHFTQDTTELISGVYPTGNILVNDNLLRVVSKNNLCTYRLSSGNATLESMIKAKGNILDFSSVDGYTLCSTNEEGYVLDFKGKNIHCEKDDNFDVIDAGEEYLPSEATSVLIYKKESLESGGKKNTYYALFGLDRGKIMIYEIKHDNDFPQLELKKTIPLLSISNNDAGKDKFIWNLRQVTDHVCFTMGNLFVNMGFDTLLNFDESNRITRSQEKESLDNYLTHLKNCYSPSKLLCVPHKISSYDFWSVK